MEIRKPKYNSLSEWRKHNSSAYQVANNKGLIEEICKKTGWILLIRKRGFRKDKIDKENSTGYQKALRNKWLDDCTKQMKKKYENI